MTVAFVCMALGHAHLFLVLVQKKNPVLGLSKQVCKQTQLTKAKDGILSLYKTFCQYTETDLPQSAITSPNIS